MLLIFTRVFVRPEFTEWPYPNTDIVGIGVIDDKVRYFTTSKQVLNSLDDIGVIYINQKHHIKPGFKQLMSQLSIRKHPVFAIAHPGSNDHNLIHVGEELHRLGAKNIHNILKAEYHSPNIATVIQRPSNVGEYNDLVLELKKIINSALKREISSILTPINDCFTNIIDDYNLGNHLEAKNTFTSASPRKGRSPFSLTNTLTLARKKTQNSLLTPAVKKIALDFLNNNGSAVNIRAGLSFKLTGLCTMLDTKPDFKIFMDCCTVSYGGIHKNIFNEWFTKLLQTIP